MYFQQNMNKLQLFKKKKNSKNYYTFVGTISGRSYVKEKLNLIWLLKKKKNNHHFVRIKYVVRTKNEQKKKRKRKYKPRKYYRSKDLKTPADVTPFRRCTSIGYDKQAGRSIGRPNFTRQG